MSKMKQETLAMPQILIDKKCLEMNSCVAILPGLTIGLLGSHIGILHLMNIDIHPLFFYLCA